MATSGGEGKQDRARSHNRTPPHPLQGSASRHFPKTGIQKFGRELERGEGWRVRPV